MDSGNSTDRSLKTKLRLIFIAAALIVGIACYLVVRNAEQLREVTSEVERSYMMLDASAEVLGAVTTMQTSTRGFALTGKQHFLDPAADAEIKKGNALSRLRQWSEHDEVRQLIQNIDKYYDWHTNLLRAARAEGNEAARRIIVEGKGEELMQNIRKLAKALELKEGASLKKAKEMSDKRTAYADGALFGLIAIAGCLVLTAYVAVTRHMDARLQAEAERNRFFALSMDLMCFANTDGYFKRINPAFSRVLGWSRDELLAKPFLDFVHPDDRTATVEKVSELSGGKSVLDFENRYRCKDGSYRVLSWKASTGPDGAIYSTARDVTVLRESEEKLRQSEHNLAVTVSSLGDGMLATDASGKITRLNPIAERLTGWSEMEAKGRDVSEVFRIVHEETREPAINPIEEVLKHGAIVGLAAHTLLINRNGSERPIDDSAAPIRGADGKLIGAVMVFRDVLMARKAERALRESEQHLRGVNEGLEERVRQGVAEVLASRDNFVAMFNSIDIAIFIHSVEGKILAVNQAVLDLYRVGQAEALTLSIEKDYSSPENPSQTLPKVWRDVLAGKFYAMEWKARRPNEGETFPVEMHFRKVLWNGQDAVMATVHDLTEKKEMEKKALRSQRLESIGTLAGGVAHDLNNALAPIMMGLELLKMEYPKSGRTVDLFEASAKRAAGMVRQLLTFAKGAEGERVVIRLKYLIKEMESIIRSTFPKNIQLTTKLPSDLPAVLGDSTQLHQVLLNLCVNARDAMPDGGSLAIEAKTVIIDPGLASMIADATPGNYVEIQVRDTGSGIPAEIVDRIFDPFFTTKGPDRGTGLGLSTTMGIVKGHGGFLNVQSQSGLGSTFSIYLPVAAPENNTTFWNATEVPFRGDGQLVLFVDDETVLRDTARTVLRRLNLEPVIASDGAEGLMDIAEHRDKLSAIITDYQMPYMDGLAFVRGFRRVLPNIPVVVMSGRIEQRVVEEFKSLGVTALLDKPFSEKDLGEVLRRILSA